MFMLICIDQVRKMGNTIQTRAMRKETFGESDIMCRYYRGQEFKDIDLQEYLRSFYTTPSLVLCGNPLRPLSFDVHAMPADQLQCK